MPLVLLLLLAILIAQVGFWDALAAILGAVAMLFLFAILLLATTAVAGYIYFRRLRRRLLIPRMRR